MWGALKFYIENKAFEKPVTKKITTSTFDLLPTDEYVVLDG
jgi:hypothetical protein